MSSRCWHLSLIFILLFKQIKKLTFAKVSSQLFTMLSRWRPPPTSRPVWGLWDCEGQPPFPHLEALSGCSPRSTPWGATCWASNGVPWASDTWVFAWLPTEWGPRGHDTCLWTWCSTTLWLLRWQLIVCPGTSGSVLILHRLFYEVPNFGVQTVTQNWGKNGQNTVSRFWSRECGLC